MYKEPFFCLFEKFQRNIQYVLYIHATNTGFIEFAFFKSNRPLNLGIK